MYWDLISHYHNPVLKKRDFRSIWWYFDHTGAQYNRNVALDQGDGRSTASHIICRGSTRKYKKYYMSILHCSKQTSQNPPKSKQINRSTRKNINRKNITRIFKTCSEAQTYQLKFAEQGATRKPIAYWVALIAIENDQIAGYPFRFNLFVLTYLFECV